MRVFGTPQAGLAYRRRHAAYAVIVDESARVACVQEKSGRFLPGGGREAGGEPYELHATFFLGRFGLEPPDPHHGVEWHPASPEPPDFFHRCHRWAVREATSVTDLSTLSAKDQIADCIHGLFVGTDARDWAKVRACFADTVHFDMTSLAGGTAANLTPGQIVRAWDEGLRAIDHVHHQAGNLLIDVRGDSATAFCYGIALHQRALPRPDNVRRFVGSYDFELRRVGGGWVISSFRFNVKFVDGNLTLEQS